MEKLKILNRLIESKFVLVLRAESKEKALEIARNSIEAGIKIIEVTFTIPQAEEVIKILVEEYGKNSEIIIGAGTVFDSETSRIAILNGAKFIVAPTFSGETCKSCNRYGIPYIPGCFTPTEIITARESGVDIAKLFPGSAFSPKIIKDLKAPIRGIGIMVSGGVNYENMNEWFKNGADVISIGSAVTSIKDKDAMRKEVNKYIRKLWNKEEQNEEGISIRGIVNKTYTTK
ncbi:MAG: bifunctional 2-keto-4-hydroxyglutarate aldolase/2-keto-3-deoxy-6-phosphogluconate aldolase [Clostridium sp.]